MKRVGSLVSLVAGAVGLEGAFFIAGVAFIAIGSAYVVSFAPWIVVGAACIIVGVALSLPRGTEGR